MEDVAVGEARGNGGEGVALPADGPREERGVAGVDLSQPHRERPGEGGGQEGEQHGGAGEPDALDQRGASWLDRVAVSCAFSAKKIAAPKLPRPSCSSAFTSDSFVRA